MVSSLGILRSEFAYLNLLMIIILEIEAYKTFLRGRSQNSPIPTKQTLRELIYIFFQDRPREILKQYWVVFCFFLGTNAIFYIKSGITLYSGKSADVIKINRISEPDTRYTLLMTIGICLSVPIEPRTIFRVCKIYFLREIGNLRNLYYFTIFMAIGGLLFLNYLDDLVVSQKINLDF